MARINSNVPSLIAQANLARANMDLEVRLERLATGLRINRGADDPSGLIISERLRSEVSGIEQAIENSERASSVIATTEASLSEVANLLSGIKALVVEAANTGALSKEETKANQLEINSAIESITRIALASSFGGLNLLNGELDYLLSGVTSTDIGRTKVNAVNFAGNPTVDVDVEVITSAQTANLFMRGDYAAVPAANGTMLSTVELEIAGPEGVQVLTFISGTALADVVDAVNSFTEATGVSAALINGNANSGVVFSSSAYGQDGFVSVEKLNTSGGDFFQTYKLPDADELPSYADFFTNFDAAAFTLNTGSYDSGRDVRALINGVLGNGDGLTVSTENSSSLAVELQLTSTFGTTQGATTTFDIVGGGALYQLGGEIRVDQQAFVGVPSMMATRLGGTSINGELRFLESLKEGGVFDLRSGNFNEASQILETAIDDVSTLRGRLGALERNTLDPNTRALQVAVENLTASESRIRDADFAKETSDLTRAQILSQAATSTLALANQNAQNVLNLLG